MANTKVGKELIEHDIEPPSLQIIFAFTAMVVGAFMAILDIQIVASSLQIIGVELSASSDELSWIQTSYLIAEVIIIPIVGFASRLLSTRIFFFISALGFTIMSVMCSFAWNIESMIIFRALQGLFGGGMIPTAFGAVFIIFPKKMRLTVNVLMGLIVTMAPTIGPTIGGYITEYISWHFMFLVNLVPGIFVSITVFLYAHFDKPNYKLLNNFDFLGIALLAISLGTLEYVLEEGSKKDWFDDTHILFLSITVFLSFIGLLIRELTCKNPIVALDAFYNRNFTCGCIYSFVLGIGLFGVIYLLPMYLFIIAGYSTVQIGITMIATGAAQFVTAPIAATLLRAGMDKRMILFIGFGAFALGCYLNSFLTVESRYWEVFIPQLIRGFALMFCFIPINDLALGTLPKDKVQNGSGLYSLIRNLGGAIGLAVINTTIISHSKIHGQAIRDDISMTAPQIQAALENLTQTLVGKVIDPELAAYRIIEDILLRESFVIAINDVFASIGLLFAFAILLIPLSNNTNNKADVH